MIASSPGHRGPFLSRLLADPRLAVVIFLLAVAQQMIGHQNFDSSWLFTVAERVLDGGRPYVDFIESNPPASFLIYFPAVGLARSLGAPVEFMVGACVFVGGAGAIFFTGRILRRADLLKAAEAAILLNMSVFLMLFVEGVSFAQRDHIACLVLMPLLGVYSARAQGSPCRLGDAIIAGLMAGLAIAIKPHFALAALFPLGFVVLRRRSLIPMLHAENWAILCLCLAYALLLILRYSAYFNILPMLLDVYVPLKRSPLENVLETWFLASLVLVCGVLAYTRLAPLPVTVATPLFAALGFMGAYLIQGKGFPNHGLPGACFAMIAAVVLASPALVALQCNGGDAPEWRSLRRPIILGLIPLGFGLPTLFGVGPQLAAWEEHPGLRAAVQRWAKPQPRLIAASTLFHVGHPVVRQVGGVFVGRSNGLWISGYAMEMLAVSIGDEVYRGRLQSYIDRDARMLLEDVRAHHPDIILTDHYPGTVRALRHPDIIAAMADYTPLETVDNVVLWGRKQ